MKRLLGVMLWVLALFVCLLGLDRAFRREDGRLKYGAFLSDAQGFDVLFFGTSHVMDAVYPPLLWRDHGIPSYNLGNAAETMEATYWTLRLALNVRPSRMPQVAVVDVCYIDRAQADSAPFAMNHLFLDELPLGAEKLRAIWALFPPGHRAEFVFPLIAYHTRWEELLSGAAQRTVDAAPYMFGAELRMGHSKPAPFVRTTEIDAAQTPGKQALCALIELCQSRGVQVVLTAIPYPAEADRQRMMNSARLIAEAYGVPFLNLFDVPGLVDFETDCYDPMSHLNPSGAAKVTAYLGEYLASHFELKDRRGDAQYAHWDAALAAYEQAFAQWAEGGEAE